MREDLLEVVAILDMSGSMGGIQSDTIGGFNAYLDQLKKTDFETIMTLVFFNNTNQTIFYRKNVNEIGHISAKEYNPGGGTALLDAIGFSITRLKQEIAGLPDEQKPGQVSFFVTTDGEENSSRQYNNQQIKKMVEQAQTEDKWNFMFAGAGIDAFAAGQNLGFQANNIAKLENDGRSQAVLYEALACQQVESKKCSAPQMSFQMRFNSKK